MTTTRLTDAEIQHAVALAHGQANQALAQNKQERHAVFVELARALDQLVADAKGTPDAGSKKEAEGDDEGRTQRPSPRKR